MTIVRTIPNVRPLFPHRQYAHPPIKEASIDLQVLLPPDVTVETLERLHDEVRESYPASKRRTFLHGELSAGDQVGASAQQAHVGYAFYSADEHYVFQASLQGFTFSRLAPYESWQDLRDHARSCWNLYRRIANPAEMRRVALRYINQIDLPAPRVDLDDYFATVPKIGPQLPQDLGQFLMQLHLPQPDLDALVIITQTMAPPPGPASVSVILDIDLIVQQTVPEADVWNLIEDLRTRKNDLFEGSITDKTRGLFY